MYLRMSASNRLLKYILLMVSALLLGACDVINEELPSYDDTSIVIEGDVAPDFTATLLDGHSITLSELRGDVVLLVFFSHTCPDCKNLLEDLKRDKDKFDAIGTRILTISRGGETAEVEEYLTTNGYNFDCAVDADRAIYSLYATMYVPRAYLINREGIVGLTTVEYSSIHIDQLLGSATQL